MEKMRLIKEVEFSDGSIGQYYATGKYRDGFPSCAFFWKGNDDPSWLCLNRHNYAYTHGGEIFREACKAWPEGYSQAV